MPDLCKIKVISQEPVSIALKAIEPKLGEIVNFFACSKCLQMNSSSTVLSVSFKRIGSLVGGKTQID
jgi:hypothetical protein